MKMRKLIFIIFMLLLPTFLYANSGSGIVMSGCTLGYDLLWFGLVGKWDLANDSYLDLSGNGLNLTESGSLAATTGHNGTASAGTVGWPYGYLYIADNALLNPTNSITISAWIKRTSNDSDYHMIVTKIATAGGNHSYTLEMSNTSKIVCRIYSDGSNHLDASSASQITDTNWHHVACVYNHVDIRVYIDGSLSSGANNPQACTTDIYNNTSTFRIGYREYAPGYYWAGSIDDVLMWSRPLGESEILLLYNAGDDFSGL
jgi:hypothetical protein